MEKNSIKNIFLVSFVVLNFLIINKLFLVEHVNATKTNSRLAAIVVEENYDEESLGSVDLFVDSFFVSTNLILGSIGLLMLALLIVLKTKKG